VGRDNSSKWFRVCKGLTSYKRRRRQQEEVVDSLFSKLFFFLDKYHSLLFSGGLYLEFLCRDSISSLKHLWRSIFLNCPTIRLKAKLHFLSNTDLLRVFLLLEVAASGDLDLERSRYWWSLLSGRVPCDHPEECLYYIFASYL